MENRRHVLVLDLKPDPVLIEKYREHHKHVWPGNLEGIRRAGILEMELWLWGNRLCMIMETEPGFSFERKAAADAGDADVQAWEKLMDTYQQQLPGAPPGSKWQPMELIFTL
jgi:L-rhamnose mutarotase